MIKINRIIDTIKFTWLIVALIFTLILVKIMSINVLMVGSWPHGIKIIKKTTGNKSSILSINIVGIEIAIGILLFFFKKTLFANSPSLTGMI